jgi:hypothetical protein
MSAPPPGVVPSARYTHEAGRFGAGGGWIVEGVPAAIEAAGMAGEVTVGPDFRTLGAIFQIT